MPHWQDYYSDPANVQVYPDSGTGDMGDLLYPTVSNEKARFWIRHQDFALAFIHVHFAGTSNSLANMGIQVDSGRGEDHDTRLHTVRNRGIDADGISVDVNWRVPIWEQRDWMFSYNPEDGAKDVVVLTWTNPDSGNISWGAEVGLIPKLING